MAAWAEEGLLRGFATSNRDDNGHPFGSLNRK
jgi:hypothetical protein